MLRAGRELGKNHDLIDYMKREFNKRVNRVKQAERYYSRPDITDEDVEKTYGTLKMLLDEINKIGREIEEVTGEKLTSDEVVNGFEGVE